MTEDLSDIARRLGMLGRSTEPLGRNLTGHSTAIGEIVNKSHRLERIPKDRTPAIR